MTVQKCSKALKENPFITYRDPTTGKWVVVKAEPQKLEPQVA